MRSSSRRLAILLIAAVAIFIVLLAFAMRRDTREERTRIAIKCDELSARLKRDPNDKKAIEELLIILDGDWPFARIHAAGALGDAGPNALPAISRLINNMDSPNLADRQAAIIAVGKISKGSPTGVGPLTKKLSVGWPVSSFAAMALAEIGADAEPALPALRALAKEHGYDKTDNSTDPFVANAAHSAIEVIEGAIKLRETNK